MSQENSLATRYDILTIIPRIILSLKDSELNVMHLFYGFPQRLKFNLFYKRREICTSKYKHYELAGTKAFYCLIQM